MLLLLTKENQELSHVTGFLLIITTFLTGALQVPFFTRAVSLHGYDVGRY